MKTRVSFLIVMALIIAAGMPLMAEGIQEQQEYAGPRNVGVELEEKELTGVVTMYADGRATLTADGEEFELLYPRFTVGQIEIESGDEITVEGVVVPGPRWEEAEETAFLRVEKALIDGEEYELDGPYAMQGGRVADRRMGYQGMMDQRGGQAGRGAKGRPGQQGGYAQSGQAWRR